MAQTIAAQRGTTTVSGNGSTATTLFTQSTGTATRVILNGVALKWDEATSGHCAMSLCVNVNGSGNYVCVGLRSTAYISSAMLGMSMMPGSSLYPVNTTPISSSVALTDRWTPYVNGVKAYFGSRLANGSWYFSGPGGINKSQQDSPTDFVPSQFWMNSGDSLVLIHINPAAYTADVVYSFTTITES